MSQRWRKLHVWSGLLWRHCFCLLVFHLAIGKPSECTANLEKWRFCRELKGAHPGGLSLCLEDAGGFRLIRIWIIWIPGQFKVPWKSHVDLACVNLPLNLKLASIKERYRFQRHLYRKDVPYACHDGCNTPPPRAAERSNPCVSTMLNKVGLPLHAEGPALC